MLLVSEAENLGGAGGAWAPPKLEVVMKNVIAYAGCIQNEHNNPHHFMNAEPSQFWHAVSASEYNAISIVWASRSKPTGKLLNFMYEYEFS